MPARLGSAGATAVWAEENTRASIFDAMKRKETYGTSGTLIRLRFFGGWDFRAISSRTRISSRRPTPGGVPMGGDLPKKPPRQGADLRVWALKDPESGNLDRIQIIKGYLGGRFDDQQEKIYDVALVGRPQGRPEDRQGAAGRQHGRRQEGDLHQRHRRFPAERRLDRPGLRSEQPAVYYVRVLEIPTPRWSTYAGRPSRSAPGRRRSGTRRRMKMVTTSKLGRAGRILAILALAGMAFGCVSRRTYQKAVDLRDAAIFDRDKLSVEQPLAPHAHRQRQPGDP